MMNFQIGSVLVLITLISISSGYKEKPREYEDDSVRHIDYEQDQMPIKVDGRKAKRMAVYEQDPNEYENEGVQHVFDENKQTPAEDRNWKVRPKVKRMSASSKNAKTVHIYLNKDEKAKGGAKAAGKKPKRTTTTTSSTTTQKEEVETQTRRAPELTTRADHVRQVEYVDSNPKDNVPSESYHSKQTANLVGDSHKEGSHHQEVINEKIKIKHHHHHHHHNHVKTVVKKEPYRVEVPVDKV